MKFITFIVCSIIFLFTGCSKNAPIYDITATNINSVKRIDNIKFPQNTLVSYIYQDGIGEFYAINSSLFSKGKDLAELKYPTFQHENIFAAYYSVLEYGRQNNFKYITFISPTPQINLSYLKNDVKTFFQHLKFYGEKYAKISFLERKEFMYKYTLEDKNSTIISNIYRVLVKYHKEKSTDYVSYNIDEMITHLEQNYGFIDTKVFNIPIGIVKNVEAKDINSEKADLHTVVIENE